MTSGVMSATTVLEVWDRVKIPGATSAGMMLCAIVFQLSLTHGYLPYGSSDVLVPLLVCSSLAPYSSAIAHIFTLTAISIAHIFTLTATSIAHIVTLTAKSCPCTCMFLFSYVAFLTCRSLAM